MDIVHGGGDIVHAVAEPREDHLWPAVIATTDISDALDDLRNERRSLRRLLPSDPDPDTRTPSPFDAASQAPVRRSTDPSTGFATVASQEGGHTMKGYVARKGNRWYAVIYEGIDPVTGKERRSWHVAGSCASSAGVSSPPTHPTNEGSASR